ncbi:MAG: 23S rRNA (guanosine(2251)-2'-O)-methyltransferase RlmB, partial [Selenomonadaceae bacterium]|nr:23S rRNA (guanosine(2251)-2'-O)-methyltransferase RlmB [Selenomonadaceae bacterium]
RLTKENCDILVKIPMIGKINSLNASVASAVLMYEVFRQRRRL